MGSYIEKKNTEGPLLIILVGLFLLMLAEWIFVNHIVAPGTGFFTWLAHFFKVAGSGIYLVRIFYVVLVIAVVYLHPSRRAGRAISERDKNLNMAIALSLSALVIAGYFRFGFYNLILYPSFLILHLIYVVRAVAKPLTKGNQRTKRASIKRR